MIAYRPDIDGLRAISILAVLLFHAELGDWAGGFVGVDVFFVISGYLICSLIAGEIAAGRFSALHFYERRVRRLLPASLPVVLFTSLFAWAFYTTDRFEEYAGSLAAFALYASNWFFYATSGYFAGEPETAPLLHTWSLAVEEQFYLVFPFAMIVLMKRPHLVRPVLSALALLSLAYSEWLLRIGKADLAFYSSLSRVFELMAGALLALSPDVKARLAPFSSPLRFAGLAAILGAMLAYEPSTPFPGLMALIPAAGALALIAASPERRDPVLTVLESGPAVFLGKISYGLYLWHWPLLGATTTLVFDHNDLHTFLALAAAVVLAALSYRYLETPIRSRKRLASGRQIAGLLAGATVASFLLGATGVVSGGWPGRIPPEIERAVAEGAKRKADPDRCFNLGDKPNRFCRYGSAGEKTDPGPVDLVLWGDSHGWAIAPAFRDYALSKGLSLGLVLRGDCAPIVGVWRSKDEAHRVCRSFNDEALAHIQKSGAKLVVIAARWSVYTEGPQTFRDDRRAARSRAESRDILEQGLARTLDGLAGFKVAIFEQVPQNRGHLPQASLVLDRLGLGLEHVAPLKGDHDKEQAAIRVMLARAEQRAGVLRFDPAEALCPTEVCDVAKDGALFYFDDDHLSLAGARHLEPFLAGALDKALTASERR